MPTILDAIGNTPLLPLNNIEVPNGCRISLKIEAANPTADVSIAHAIDVAHTHMNLATALLKQGDTTAARTEPRACWARWPTTRRRDSACLRAAGGDPEIRAWWRRVVAP